jgi:hypothetical protein
MATTTAGLSLTTIFTKNPSCTIIRTLSSLACVALNPSASYSPHRSAIAFVSPLSLAANRNPPHFHFAANQKKASISDIMPKTRRQRRSDTTNTPTGRPQIAVSSSGLGLADSILQGLQERADPQTKAWFSNYVKNTQWIGCKVPVVRATIQDILKTHKGQMTTETLLQNAISLLQNPHCDAKLGGMILLGEKIPLSELATCAALDRLDAEIWNDHSYIDDWSTADWLSMRVLSKIALAGNSQLTERILNYTRAPNSSLWQRRCGIVSFLRYHQAKHAGKIIIDNFGLRLIHACEDSLLQSPEERFTQTGIAWVLRYVLLEASSEEQEAARAMICRRGDVWTMEAKKSLVEKLGKKDSRRAQILALGTKDKKEGK